MLQKFGNQLCEGNIIEICNFNVQSASNKKYKVSSHEFFIRLTERARVASVEQEFYKISPEKFRLCTYDELVKLKDKTDDLYGIFFPNNLRTLFYNVFNLFGLCTNNVFFSNIDTIGYIVKVDKGDVRSKNNPTATLRKVDLILLLEK